MSKGRWIALAVALAAALVVEVIVWRASANRHTDWELPPTPVQTGAAPTQTSVTPTPLSVGVGADGAGDPYFRNYGASGYDAQSYEIDVTWNPDASLLSGTTVMTARASSEKALWKSFSVDLLLRVKTVTVDGLPATFTHAAGSRDVTITPKEPIIGGSDFTMTVTYSGDPARQADKDGWIDAGGEWLAVGQPESAPNWFASNDHPSDPATFDVSVRVPSKMQVLSAGHLVSRDIDNEPDWDTWQYTQDQPVPTYAVFLTVGSYQIETGTDGERRFVYAVTMKLSTSERARVMKLLRTTGAIVRELEALLGPYPLTDLGGVVTTADLWFAALETAGRPVYKYKSTFRNVIVHEMAHMWVGDTVTLKQWKDIYINEAMASYATWVLEEREGGQSAASQLKSAYQSLTTKSWQISMSNPGPDKLFTTVYTRGPMSLQALRNRFANDTAFFAMLKDWAQQKGPRSLPEFRTFAAQRARADLSSFFEAWIDAKARPAKTRTNGLG